jgi:hypothetical protein
MAERGSGARGGMNPAHHEFCPEGYARLLDAFRRRGYGFAGFEDITADGKCLILRHDIDFSLPAALRMAEQERETGVRATYFVLVRTEFYNPLSQAGLAALQKIAAFGHDIGLHFDAALYPDGESEAAAKRECDLLAAALNRTVGVVSLHRPGAVQIGEQDRVGGRINAYGPRYARAIGYCSDSRGAWTHGHPLDHAAVAAGRALQLLVHPFWWQAPALPPAERLRRFLAERAAFLDRELAKHCSVHEPAPRS